MRLFSYPFAVSFATKINGDECQQHHEGGDAEQVFLRHVDDVSVDIIDGNGLGGMFDDEIEKMAEGVMEACGKPSGSARVLDKEDIIKIYNMAK